MDSCVPEPARPGERRKARELPALGLQGRREDSIIARLRSASRAVGCSASKQTEGNPCGGHSCWRGSMRKLLLVAFGLVLPFALIAQQPAPDTTKPAPAPPPPASVAVPVDFSGVLYANFQYRGDKGTSKSQNKFDVERAYLTFRMPAGDRASIRITADVFQQTTTPNDAFYRGWVIRAKYAYLQYDLIKSASWNANIRGGLLHTVVIDHIEQFLPRWLSTSPVERAGFFSSSDAGVAATLSFPNKLGEIYATIVN